MQHLLPAILVTVHLNSPALLWGMGPPVCVGCVSLGPADPSGRTSVSQSQLEPGVVAGWNCLCRVMNLSPDFPCCPSDSFLESPVPG